MSDPAPAGADVLAAPELGGAGLRHQSARGTLVNGAFLVGLYSLGLLKGFVVAGFLTRSDYGVWGVLVVTLATFLWLKQVGVSDKYVQQSESDQELAFQRAFTIELLLTGAFVILLLAAIPLVALAYGRPELLLPGLVVVSIPVAGVLSTPLWIFYRRMEFVKQRSLQAVEPVVGFVLTVVLAIAGAGYWSLVVGAAAGAWTAAIVAVRASPYRLAFRYDRAAIREYASFSGPVFIAGLSGIVIAQGSILLGEKELGLAGVGAITLAATLSQYTDRVDGIITATLYPAICAVRHRRDLLLESFVKSNRLALMWGVPFGIALALFAPDLVRFGIGEQWRPAVLLLQIFGLNQALNHIGFNWTAFYRALGNTRPLAITTFVTMLAFLAVPAPLLITHGLNGFAIGMAVMTAVALALRTYFLGRLFPTFEMARHAVRAIAPTVPAVLTVLALRALEGGGRTLPVALGELAAYLAVTVLATLRLERALLREIVGYLRRPSVQAQSPA